MQLSVIWRDREQLTQLTVGDRNRHPSMEQGGSRLIRPMHTALLIDNQHRIRRRVKAT